MAMSRKDKTIQSSWECKLMQPLWRTVWSFLKKLKIELPYNPGILLLDTYPKEIKSVSQKALHVYCSIIHYHEDMKTTFRPTGGEKNNEIWNILDNGYDSVWRNWEILPFPTTWMNLEDVLPNGISQTRKNKNTCISIHMWNSLTQRYFVIMS